MHCIGTGIQHSMNKCYKAPSMAPLFNCFTAIASLFLLVTQPTAVASQAIVLQAAKDPLTHQHTAVVHQRTPLVPLKLSLDLGGDSLWVDCESGYNSSSYRSINCNEDPRCSLLRPLGCYKESCFEEGAPWFCNDKACVTGIFNPFNATWDESYFPGQNWYEYGEAAVDVLSLRYTTYEVALASQFLFTCVETWFTKGFATGVKGVAGLGPTAGALPTQLAQTFGLPRKFAVCLSSSTVTTGAVVFGDFPVNNNNISLTPMIRSTPLLKNPASNQSFVVRLFSEYYINVISIKVNGKIVAVDTTLLSFYNDRGDGGTKISTADPYAVLKSPIYRTLVDAFLVELSKNAKKVPSPTRSPFETCFIGVPVTSPQLPSLSLVLQENAEWKITGPNLFVPVGNGVICLGFVEDRRLLQDQEGASIVIGAQQMEDHMLMFDLPASSLSVRKTSCAGFSSKTIRRA